MENEVSSFVPSLPQEDGDESEKVLSFEFLMVVLLVFVFVEFGRHWFRSTFVLQSKKEKDMLAALKTAQDQQKKYSLVDDFVEHSCLQRKINSLQKQLSAEQLSRYGPTFYQRALLRLLSSFPLPILSFFLVVWFSDKGVMEIGWEKDELFYGGSVVVGLMEFPWRREGVISFSLWVLACNQISTKLSSFVLGEEE